MKSKKKLFALILAMFAIGLSIFLIYNKHQKSLDLPGDVIGSNPNHIPKDQLPICDFTGARFIKEPCYSPPGSVYM
jgi:hypothetical protein